LAWRFLSSSGCLCLASSSFSVSPASESSSRSVWVAWEGSTLSWDSWLLDRISSSSSALALGEFSDLSDSDSASATDCSSPSFFYDNLLLSD
jgi:hypothetical protein